MTSTRAAVAVLAMGALVVTLGLANTGAAGRGCDRRGHDGAPGAFIEENAARLGLDPEKTGLIRERFEASHGKRQEMKEELHEAREKLHDLLAGDLPDRDQVMEQIEAIGELRTKAKKQKIGTMIDVREMLTAEQRAELAQIRSEKRGNSEELCTACREAGDGQRCKHDRREYP